MIPHWVMTTLRTLRDVPGVEGSFVFGPDGRLLARDLPAVLSDQLLSEVAGRLGILLEASGGGVAEVEAAHLTYADHALMVFRGPACSLGVLANPATNPSTLALGARLALRRLAEGLSPRAMSSSSSPLPGPPPVPRISGPPRPSSVRATSARPKKAPSKKKKKKRGGGIWGD
jgi:predicted regulator of Ras-like GTPase activity (Roadblock/LC7/MglB family)